MKKKKIHTVKCKKNPKALNLEQISAFIIHHHLAKIKREIRAKKRKKTKTNRKEDMRRERREKR
jgi:hypothetical protein